LAYRPNPIDTSRVRLSPEILELAERLAENTHENWAKERFSAGWIYGDRRNDALKKHPCLVPYDQLPDSEKDLDRALATQTLKALIALGYNITKGRVPRA